MIDYICTNPLAYALTIGAIFFMLSADYFYSRQSGLDIDRALPYLLGSMAAGGVVSYLLFL